MCIYGYGNIKIGRGNIRMAYSQENGEAFKCFGVVFIRVIISVLSVEVLEFNLFEVVFRDMTVI